MKLPIYTHIYNHIYVYMCIYDYYTYIYIHTYRLFASANRLVSLVWLCSILKSNLTTVTRAIPKNHFITAWSLLQCLKHTSSLIISLWIIYFVNYLWSFRAPLYPSCDYRGCIQTPFNSTTRIPLPLPTIHVYSGNLNSLQYQPEGKKTELWAQEAIKHVIWCS